MRAPVALCGLAVLLSCAGNNTLDGSVGDLFPLQVSTLQVLRNEQAFQVSYYANHGTNVDIVARLTVALAGVDFVPGGQVPLAGEYTPGHQRTSVIHLAAGEPELLLPDVATGSLHLVSGGEPGQATSGDFSLSFVKTGDVGGGRTLNGVFRATAQDAGFGPGL